MQATEKDYEELERLGAKLHIAVPTAIWGFKLESPDGEIVYEKTERAHSWVRNAYNLLASTMCQVNATGTTSFGNGNINFKDVTATLRGVASNAMGPLYNNSVESAGYGYIGPSGDSSKGIVVGTGNTAYSFDDYKLAAAVANGNGVGQLAHSLSSISKSWDSVNKKYNVVHSRIFNNNSTADIVVAEGGIIGNLCHSGGVNSSVLLCRDVYDIPYTIPAAYKFTVSYTMSVQFPTV